MTMLDSIKGPIQKQLQNILRHMNRPTLKIALSKTPTDPFGKDLWVFLGTC